MSGAAAYWMSDPGDEMQHIPGPDGDATMPLTAFNYCEWCAEKPMRHTSIYCSDDCAAADMLVNGRGLR